MKRASALPIARLQRAQILRQILREIGVAGGDDLVDHPLQSQALAVLGREDAGDAVRVQLVDLGRHDHAAAAAEDLDVRAAALAQQVEHVLEELDVAALVGRDRDAVRVFLQRAVDDLVDRAVVAEVDHFAARRLEDAPHDVDRRVVAVEQARRGDEADLVRRLVDQRLFGDGEVVHHCSGGRIRDWAGACAQRRGRKPACAGQDCAGKLTPGALLSTLYSVYVNVNIGAKTTAAAGNAFGARRS